MTEHHHYPVFDPPEQLAGTEPDKWTKSQARAYFDWLVHQVEPRSRALLAWLGVEDRPDHAGVLAEAGAASVERLRSPGFSGPGGTIPMVLKGHEFEYEQGPVLLADGLALAADLGLLVARYLLADFRDQVRFEVGGRPKSWVAYNRPILTGGGINPFDPVGASIGNSHGVLRGERDASIWARMYQQSASTLRATGPGKP